MPVLMGVLGVLGHLALELLMALVTKTFLKKIIILALEKLVKKTASDIDDQVLAAAKEAWETNA